jgi:hypothetical protein
MVLSSLVAGRIGAVGSVRDGYESGSAIGRGTKWSVGGEAVWQCGDGGLWSAAEGRPQAPWSSGRDRRCGRADGLTALSRNGSLPESRHYVQGEARHCRSGAVCGGWSAAESRHCLRQQAERLPPGCPEGFSVLTQSTDRSVSEDRTEAAVLKGLEE